MTTIRYERAPSLAEALEIRAARPVTVVAGGTDVYPARTARLAFGDPAPIDVLDISGIPGLGGLALQADGSVRIGALATWSAVAAADLPAAFDGLRAAALRIGGAQVQNRGTVAGNLVTASPAGDGIVCLASLDATVELASRRGLRSLPVSDFVTGYRTTALGDDELVTAVTVPAPLEGEAGGFLKLGARAYLVISIAMVAGTLAVGADGRIRRARLAVGACGPRAERLPGLEADLAGRPAAEAAAAAAPAHLSALSPIDDVRATADYRRAAALRLVQDLLAALGRGAERRAA